MKKRLLAALLTSALALSLTACGGSTDSSAAPDGATPPPLMTARTRSAWCSRPTLPSSGTSFRQARKPTRRSIRIRSIWTSRALRLRPTTRSSSTPSRPTLRFESYDGYLIAPLQSEAVATAIANTDKPVVAYDTRIDSDKCLAFVGTGNKEAAKEGGKAAVEAAKAAGWTDIKCIERSQAFRVTQPTPPAWKATAKA